MRGADGALHKVSEEVYRNYYHIRRRERYQEEQKKKNGVASLDAIGYDTNFLSRKPQERRSEIEDMLVMRCYDRILREEIDKLPSWDKRMIGLLYYSGLTVKDAAKTLGCCRGKIYAHRRKAFEKIRSRFHREGIDEYEA